MDNIIWGVAAGFGVAVVLVVIFWELAKDVYFAVAAKWYDWSEDEKFMRETARVDRISAREEQLAKRDEIAARDRERRRTGVAILTFATAGAAFQMNIPWWQAGLITALVYTGLTMTAGLSFNKWW